MVSYCDDPTQQSQQDKLKKFRQFHNNSEHMAGNYKFWYIEDKNVAKTLGIDTSKGTTGDIYTVRAADPNFTSSKPTSNIFGFKFTSEILMTGPEVQATPDEAVKKLQELSFNNPIVVNDEVKFRKMLLGLPTLLVYCDPNIHG